MSNRADAIDIMNEMFRSCGIGYLHQPENNGKCSCGRTVSDLENRCIVCLTHELAEFSGEVDAQRFMLKLKELNGLQQSILWQMEHGRIDQKQW